MKSLEADVCNVYVPKVMIWNNELMEHFIKDRIPDRIVSYWDGVINAAHTECWASQQSHTTGVLGYAYICLVSSNTQTTTSCENKCNWDVRVHHVYRAGSCWKVERFGFWRVNIYSSRDYEHITATSSGYSMTSLCLSTNVLRFDKIKQLTSLSYYRARGT